MSSEPDKISHLVFMSKALTLARRAEKKGEVPIGALLVVEGKIVARGHNLTRSKKDPTLHAEMVVIRKASRLLGNERLLGATLYVTLEPCAMCAGAIVQARILLVVYGASDPKAGACGSVMRVIPNRRLNHRPAVVKGVCAKACGELLKAFFRRRRRGRRQVRLVCPYPADH
ncbi:MAG: tRNA adenosine(34) deaminase TadA [Elusimicrobia bacterium]|nr:tRNA adenosine(34) deaminase TadA [Candidatus Obscuribacterium magneticum]